jgi:hypothetical protein
VRKDPRIRGCFSLELSRTDVNVEKIKHMFMPCQQKVGLNQTITVRNNYAKNSDILQQNKEIKYSFVTRSQNFIHEYRQNEIKLGKYC